ncbi:hypothetical protein B7494_g422 [Chlorociboria aeruginascens]|nr:hypothetical protein B7494_g422 [Chlorociboria aeruginascens]
MSLQDIISHLTTAQMRNQLSELNMSIQGYGCVNSSLLPQLLSIKEEYTKANLLSYSEKLDILLGAIDNTGTSMERSETHDHVFADCKVVQRRFLSKLEELEQRVTDFTSRIPCTECRKVQKQLSETQAILKKTIEEHQLKEADFTIKVSDANEDIQHEKDQFSNLGTELHRAREKLEEALLYRARKYQHEQKYRDAEEEYLSLIKLRREILGRINPCTDETVDDTQILDYRYELAETQIKQGEEKYPVAEKTAYELYQTKVKFFSENGGEDASESRKSFRQWCRTLQLQGNEKKCRVEQMYRDIWYFKRVDRLWRLENGFKLGFVSEERGEIFDAQSQYRRVWGERNKVVQGDGESQIKELNGFACAAGHQLGSLLYDEGNYEEAASILQEVWSVQKLVLPEYDTKITTTAELLRTSYFYLKDLAKEEELCLWTWKVYKKEETDSAKTLERLKRLADIQFIRRNFEAAAISYKELWKERSKKKSWKKDVQSLHANFRYCRSLYEQGQPEKYNEAKPIIKENWEARIKYLEKDSPSTLESGHIYGVILSRLGSYADADKVLKEVWIARGKILEKKEDDIQTLNSGHEYGVALLGQTEEAGKLEEARHVLDLTFKTRQRVLGESHVDTLETGHEYIMARLELEQELPGLEEIARDIYERRLKALPKNDPRTLSSGLAYGTVVIHPAAAETTALKEKGLKNGAEIFRGLWILRNELVPGSEAHTIALEGGFALAITLRDLGGENLEESRDVIDEFVTKVSKHRVGFVLKNDSLNQTKEDIHLKLEEWEKVKKGPGQKQTEVKRYKKPEIAKKDMTPEKDLEGTNFELESPPRYDYSDISHAHVKGGRRFRFLKHIAKNI